MTTISPADAGSTAGPLDPAFLPRTPLNNASQGISGYARDPSTDYAGSGVCGLGGKEDGADLEPMDAHSAGCAGCAGGTAWGVVRSEGRGGPLSVGADARGRVVAAFEGMVTVARRS